MPLVPSFSPCDGNPCCLCSLSLRVSVSSVSRRNRSIMGRGMSKMEATGASGVTVAVASGCCCCYGDVGSDPRWILWTKTDIMSVFFAQKIQTL